MANLGIVRERDVRGEDSKPRQGGARGEVASTIMGDITPWRKLRENEFEDLWDEYYAKWRGFWMPQHKNYKTERSKLISPLLSMSIDLTSAEIIEAVFGREYFVDIPDDVQDGENEDVDQARKLLVQDLRQSGFVEAFGNTVVNGCLYGTGIMKIQVGTKIEKVPVRKQNGDLIVSRKEVPVVKPVTINPDQFVPDPSTSDIDMMKGCAHEFRMPVHSAQRMQMEGQWYKDVALSAWEPVERSGQNRKDTENSHRRELNKQSLMVTEYYGLISRRQFLRATAEGNGSAISSEVLATIPAGEMVEVIATVVNETHLVRLIETPLITGERLIMSYQHESVSGRFWGRGVAEKATSVQRAMDAEMRARIDALAWSNNPMFAGDLTRMPKGSNLSAWPGKFWGTRGNPNDIIQEFKITGPDANTFQHMQDLERMGQQATGALDSISLRSGMRDETATGSALAASGFIKRSKRTMYNIEEFLNKLIRRTLRLKMQYEKDKYPEDYDFRVKGTIGIMSREIEQQFMISLMQTIGGDSPAAMPILMSIFEHSGSPVKEDVLKALRAMQQRQPTPEEEAAQKAALEAPVLENEKLEAEIMKLMSEAGKNDATEDKTRAEVEQVDADGNRENIKVMNDLQETENQERQLDIQEEKLELDRQKLRVQARNKT